MRDAQVLDLRRNQRGHLLLPVSYRADHRPVSLVAWANVAWGNSCRFVLGSAHDCEACLMGKRAIGSKSLRSFVAHRVTAWLWVRAELRAENAKKRYHKAYERRYGRVAGWDQV